MAFANATVTISCVVNGLHLSFTSPSDDLVDCESLLRYANISVNERSVTGVIWSCLATIFACTWVSAHPNIPHPDATDRQIRSHRLLLMLCGLIAPELIVLWALRQWAGARSLVKKMEGKSIAGFTMVHGHFLQMGGFMLYADDTRIGLIEDGHEFLSCLHWPGTSKFSLPSTTQIQDKSKGDGLSKALVVVQAAWFMAQCIARWAAGLAVTEIELVTLALAALNGIIYFLWWHKPVDVRCAIPVVYHTADFQTIPDHIPTSMTSLYSSSAEFKDPESSTIPIFSIATAHSNQRKWKPVRVDDLHDIKNLFSSINISKLFRGSNLDHQHAAEGNPPHKRRPLQISPLHSICDAEDTFGATAVASAIAILFGAIHCVGWNFSFPTAQEKMLWRIWSVIITLTPLFLLLRGVIWFILIRRLARVDDLARLLGRVTIFAHTVVRILKEPSIWITALLVPVYIIARCGLLIQAVVALRDLQVAERAPVNWVSLLPHI